MRANFLLFAALMLFALPAPVPCSAEETPSSAMELFVQENIASPLADSAVKTANRNADKGPGPAARMGAEEAVGDAVDRRIESKMGQLTLKLVSAAAIQLEGETVGAQEAYKAATLATDKQAGAGPDASGTTTVVQKANFASLLSLALDYGAIKQEKNGSTVTLTTTPYLALSAVYENPEQFLDGYGLAERIGFSGTFALSDESDSPQRENLTQASCNFRILGGETLTGKKAGDKWRATVQPKVQEYLNTLSGTMHETFNGNDGPLKLDELQKFLYDLIDTIRNNEDIKASIETTIENNKLDDNEKTDSISKQIVSLLGPKIDIFAKRLSLPPQDPLSITIFSSIEQKNNYTKRMMAAAKQKAAIEKAQDDFIEALADQESPATLTLGYTFNNLQDASDYSQAKLLFEYKGKAPSETSSWKPNILANATIGLNHNNYEGTALDTVRDYGASVALEFKFDNALATSLMNDSSAPMTLSLAYSFSRLEDQERSTNTGQIKFTLPVSTGLDIPISASYASGTEDSGDSEFKVTAGLSLDMDKLKSLANLKKALRLGVD